MQNLHWLPLLVVILAYLKGIQSWIYEERTWFGIAAVCLAFPLLIHLTVGHSPANWLQGLPLVGVAMFLHRYRSSLLRQYKLLQFSTLSMIVIVTYFILTGTMPR